jgi:putative phosphoribosyl transferase
MLIKFPNRTAAGQMLAKHLTAYSHREDVLVLGLPRGGVPVAFEVATALNVPLDICLVRKLGVPGHPELAMGALARLNDGITGDVRILNHDVINYLGISQWVIDEVTALEWQELQRRDRAYRGDRPILNVKNKTIILIDDGIATGSTMRAAIAILQKQQPAKIIVAVPVAAPITCEELRSEVDEIVCLSTPELFSAIGAWYQDFTQTTDEEVRELLAKSGNVIGKKQLSG